MAATARPTWRCSRCSDCHTCRGVLDAYDEVAPLAEGWQDRAGVHQLFPLLVHACLFGGGYGARAGATAARYL